MIRGVFCIVLMTAVGAWVNGPSDAVGQGGGVSTWQANQNYNQLKDSAAVLSAVRHFSIDDQVATEESERFLHGQIDGDRPIQRDRLNWTFSELPTESSTSLETNGQDNSFVPRIDIKTDLNHRSLVLESGTNRNGDQLGLIWWAELVERPFDPSRQTETATSGDLLQMSLTMSPRIQAISQEPLIREAQIIEADADFDPAVFLRNIFEDRTDPVGNTLTTGGAEFLEDHIFTSNTGIRRKLRTGGNLELSQRLGFQNSNSQFFVPQDQGTATLAINLSQPVLRDGGRYFNRLQILIAQAATDVSWEVFSSELQDELQRVLSAYWQLVYDRSNFLQKQRNYERGQQILETLVQRQGLDSLPSQVARARSSVEARKTSLANALRDVRNAESNIRRLTGDPDFAAKQDVELLPLERPIVQDFSIPLKQIVNTALNQRPEIREMAKRTKIAALQLDVSTNQLLPELALLMGTYVSGLEGDTGIERAWVEQFSNTTPGYSLGFEFSRPVGNRAALSRLTQSQLQLRKLENEWKESMQRVISESQIAYRGVESAVQTLKAAMVSIQAAHQDLIQQARRFEEFALIEGDLSDGRSPTTILDQLLDSQERLTSAENLYAQTMLEYQVASIALSRATGTLLLHHRVSFEHGGGSGCLPAVRLYRSPTDGDF